MDMLTHDNVLAALILGMVVGVGVAIGNSAMFGLLHIIRSLAAVVRMVWITCFLKHIDERN